MRNIRMPFIFSIIIIVLTGCAGKSKTSMLSEFSPAEMDLSRYQPKVDHFVIIHDASQSMHEMYGGQKKFYQVKNLASRMVWTLPESDIRGGIRTFGHGWGGPREPTALIYGMENFNHDNFQAALDTVTVAGGNTPLGPAIKASGDDLGGASGNVAVIAISDGKQWVGGSPVEAVQALKENYGDTFCFYSVVVGDDPKGAEVMTAAAEASGCGFAVNGDDIYDAAGIFMKNPGLNAEIQGHTDNVGTAEYNQKLSERRAGAVAEYLVGKGVESGRLTSKGFGFSAPVTSNDTPEGRQQNRRVEIAPMK